MMSDLKLSIRGLLKSPAFLVTAVLALALGIGANTAIFSAVNSVLLNPADIRDADQVVALRTQYLGIDGLNDIGLSAASFKDYENLVNIFQSAAIAQPRDFNFTGSETPERLRAAMTSPRFFDVVGHKPVMGRTYNYDEDQPNNNRVVVLSYHIWQRIFGGDPNIVDKMVQFNEEPHKVLGVMPEGFRFPVQADLWTPLGLDPQAYNPQRRYNEQYGGFARLKPGVTIEQANAAIKVMVNQIVERENQGRNRVKWGLFVKPATDATSGPLKLALWVLMGASGFVLLIACANIAGLLLARASSRTKEVAIRTALGASRWDLMRQLLTESLLLSVTGGLLGLLVGFGGVKWLMAVGPAGNTPQIQMDWRVFAFTAVVSIVCGLFFGLFPAWQASRSKNQYDILKDGGRSGTAGLAKQRARSVLVAAEMAIALVLLVGCGLFLRSLAEAQKVNPGFTASGVQTAFVGLSAAKYRQPSQRANFYSALDQRLRKLPGAAYGGLAVPMPFSGDNWSGSFRIVGQTVDPNEPSPHGDQRYVSPDYFATMGIPLLRGRFFTESDSATAPPVMIIDIKLANRYFPNMNPIGQKIQRGGPQSPQWEIVGVVGHVHQTELESDTKGAYFTPMVQQPPPMAGILVKTAGGADPGQLVGAIRAAVREVDPNQPMFNVKTMEERVQESLGSRRIVVGLLSLFGGLALTLAALGLYGVISFAVTQRTQEIGIRMALGAERSSVLGMVLGQGARLAVAGVVVGCIGAYATARLIATQLYQVQAFDPVTFGVVALVLSVVALGASYIPALRATKVDPLIALRYE
jgi:predicted permease